MGVITTEVKKGGMPRTALGDSMRSRGEAEGPCNQNLGVLSDLAACRGNSFNIKTKERPER